MSYTTPVLFLIFNKPSLTSIVFREIRKLKPRNLYIAADGPREDKTGEIETCAQTRKLVLEGIDWDCEVKTLLRQKNLGCGRAVSEAITWFFENVEAGVILEDDCVPDPTFFDFCSALLARYRDNHQVMHVGGANFQPKSLSGKSSYYFSNYVHVWGWATWRRAWQLYNYDIPGNFSQALEPNLKRKFSSAAERAYWMKSFDGMVFHNIDTWDIQWSYCVYKNDGISITPAVNLVSNIGYGPDATHTHHFDPKVAALPLAGINTIQHPPKVKILKKADNYTFKTYFRAGDTRFNRIKFQIGKKVPLIKKGYLKIFK